MEIELENKERGRELRQKAKEKSWERWRERIDRREKGAGILMIRRREVREKQEWCGVEKRARDSCLLERGVGMTLNKKVQMSSIVVEEGEMCGAFGLCVKATVGVVHSLSLSFNTFLFSLYLFSPSLPSPFSPT